MGRTAFVLITLAVAGCSTSLSARGSMIRDASDASVAPCKFVGRVQGSSGWGGAAASETGKHNAMNDAREKAADLGATHVVWRSARADGGGGMADGEAYRCPDPGGGQ